MKPLFLQQIQPQDAMAKPALWFVFHNEEILLYQTNESIQIPQLNHISNLLDLPVTQEQYMGIYGDTHCFAAEVEYSANISTDFSFISLRQASELLKDEFLFSLATRAKQLLFWDKGTRFCGYCGKETQFSTSEYCKICSHCQALFYPQISPVVLILITRGDEILLARSAHFVKDMYSILAGFVEPGETAEQAAIRETMEEVGLAIKNIGYFSSQPWAFPSNLMLGFTAEYAGGELKIDPKEIEDAQWFNINQLPQLPKSASLSRKMIDAFLTSKYNHSII